MLYAKQTKILTEGRYSMSWSSLLSHEIPTKAEVQEAIDAASQIIGSNVSNYIQIKSLKLMICWGLIQNYTTSNVYTSFPMSFSQKPYIVTTENGRENGANSYNKVVSWSTSGFYWTGDKCDGHYIAIGVKY